MTTARERRRDWVYIRSEYDWVREVHYYTAEQALNWVCERFDLLPDTALKKLGLHGPRIWVTRGTPCTRCGVPMVPGNRKTVVPEGWARHYGHGLCAPCYRKRQQATTKHAWDRYAWKNHRLPRSWRTP